MGFSDLVSTFLVLGVSALLSPFLARWLVRVLTYGEGETPRLFRLVGISSATMSWKPYVTSLLVFHAFGIVTLMIILMSQGFLPLNPMKVPGLSLDLAFNTAVSFVTNTNWQAYSGESTLSYLSQMLGLGTQNFVSAASGIAVMAALARSLKSRGTSGIGNFWHDIFRITIYFLIPLSVIWALALVSQGVLQNLSAYLDISTLEGSRQSLPMGPAASQIAIKQLGSNGGGFFGVNSAHPFENPTFISNALQTIALVLIPMACPIAFGILAGAKRHGWTLFWVMLSLLVGGIALASVSEMNAASLLGHSLLEGKELRFGSGLSVLWGTLTTATSNGSVNAMISSFSPLAGGVALLNIMLGEVVFGGVGSGVYGMYLFAVLTVFIAGLMVGRSPEFLGKKIEAAEIRLSVIGVLLPSVLILGFSALAAVHPVALKSLSHTGPHGLSELLYAFSSGAGNNGSAFAGLGANTPFFNISIAVAMFLGRLGVIVPVLGLAGLLSHKTPVPESAGTFPVSGTLFGLLLMGVVLIVGALTFFPALALGPIVEHLQFIAR